MGGFRHDSVFTEMSALAERTGAINLGQGFPDEDGPAEVLEAAQRAIRDGHNQYAPLPGVPALREAIAAHQARFYGIELDPGTQVQVTFGATEAIAAALLGLCDPGDEVVCFEPYYDSYAAGIAMAGAVRRPVTLRPPDWPVDPEALAAAITPKARVLLLNTPHNPTGKVFSRAELELVAAACIEHDLIAVTDEVYEHIVFDGEHVPLSTLPGMAERTLTISSLGKTFSVTGWKTGWATGPAELVAATRKAKQFLTFAGGTPFQHAGAVALGLGDEVYTALETRAARQARPAVRRARGGRAGGAAARRHLLRQRRLPAATASSTAASWSSARASSRSPRACSTTTPTPDRTLVRFAFCKREAVIDEAARKLASAPRRPARTRRRCPRRRRRPSGRRASAAAPSRSRRRAGWRSSGTKPGPSSHTSTRTIRSAAARCTTIGSARRGGPRWSRAR